MSVVYEMLRRAQEEKWLEGLEPIDKSPPPVPLETKERREIEKGISVPDSRVVLKTPPLKESDPPKERDLVNDDTISLPLGVLIEMLQEVRKTATSIYEVGLFAVEKPGNGELKKHFRKTIVQDFDKIDSVLNILSGYASVSTPIPKKNTAHMLLDQFLEKNEKKLQSKNVTVTRRYDPAMPEATLHDEQMRFILDSILRCALLSAPFGGHIDVVTRATESQKDQENGNGNPLKGRWGEILISCSGHPISSEEGESSHEGQNSERKDSLSFMLVLIKELVYKNRGLIRFEVDERKGLTRIYLRFPAERRHRICYRTAYH